jgi:tRNA nucleotidyltransferase/poly(A) polymerase
LTFPISFGISDNMNENATKVMTILEDAGFEARIAGGAVRDFLLGKDPKDIDIATTARPGQTIQEFEALGYNVIPTGLQHGTVTVMVGREPFEITTLRIDKETNGRHAEVEFHTDWELDAARRDFTFNAMFMDKDGTVYDYFNGADDLKNCVVRFVGNARDRIEEDYLRILRYFRFLGRMKTVNFDATFDANMKVIQDTCHGLDKISGERIWAELHKILSQPKCITIARLLVNYIGPQLGIPVPHHPMVKDFNHEEWWMLKLIALFDYNEHRILNAMTNRFRAPSYEIEFVKTYFMMNHSRTTNFEILSHCYKNDFLCMFVMDLVKLKRTKDWEKWDKFFTSDFPGKTASWEIRPWPVNASDLMTEGFKPGPELGKELKKRRSEWIDNLIATL